MIVVSLVHLEVHLSWVPKMRAMNEKSYQKKLVKVSVCPHGFKIRSVATDLHDMTGSIILH